MSIHHGPDYQPRGGDWGHDASDPRESEEAIGAIAIPGQRFNDGVRPSENLAPTDERVDPELLDQDHFTGEATILERLSPDEATLIEEYRKHNENRKNRLKKFAVVVTGVVAGAGVLIGIKAWNQDEEAAPQITTASAPAVPGATPSSAESITPSVVEQAPQDVTLQNFSMVIGGETYKGIDAVSERLEISAADPNTKTSEVVEGLIGALNEFQTFVTSPGAGKGLEYTDQEGNEYVGREALVQKIAMPAIKKILATDPSPRPEGSVGPDSWLESVEQDLMAAAQRAKASEATGSSPAVTLMEEATISNTTKVGGNISTTINAVLVTTGGSAAHKPTPIRVGTFALLAKTDPGTNRKTWGVTSYRR